jgi:hypothetical protein
VRCCTYVAIEVDAPTSPWQYDQYIWLLYHRNVWMYLDRGNHWYVQFETVCNKLSPQGHCTVHGRHPVLCKDYDPRSCERRGDLSNTIARWSDGDELAAWLRERRPSHYRRWKAWYDKKHAPKEYANAPAQVRDEGAARGGNLRRAKGAAKGVAKRAAGGTKGMKKARQPKPAPKAIRYEMPPPPVNPLLLLAAAKKNLEPKR